MASDEALRMMRCIDHATDPGWAEELIGSEEFPTGAAQRAQVTQERIADALAAIAFLLLRRDEEMWSEWLRY